MHVPLHSYLQPLGQAVVASKGTPLAAPVPLAWLKDKLGLCTTSDILPYYPISLTKQP